MASGAIVNYLVEKKSAGKDSYTVIGQVAVAEGATMAKFGFTDELPGDGNSEYRIKAIDKNGQTVYSNTVRFNNRKAAMVQVYPNPVQQMVNIILPANIRADYAIRLMAANGQLLFTKEIRGGNTGTITIKRTPAMRSGVYFLKITNVSDGIEQIEKLVFE
jgi:hypothetical protein